MRICASVPLYPPNSRVGAWLTTHEFLLAAAAAGHEVDVVTYMGDPIGDYGLDGVMVRPRADLLTFAESADVIVSHLGDDQRASRLAKRLRIPSVRMVHGIPTAGHILDDDLAVFNSRSLADVVGWDGPSIVAHPPVAVEDYRTTPGDLVTLVNLTVAKGASTLWSLARRMRDVQFLGVGGGYGHQMTRRTSNVELAPATVNMPHHVYSRTRILLMPSIRETWGRVAIEAACSGIPTIASPTPGLRESLGDAGTFVDRRDLDGWEAAIRHLLDPAEWAEASRRASVRAAELDPTDDLARFVSAVEALVPAKAAA